MNCRLGIFKLGIHNKYRNRVSGDELQTLLLLSLLIFLSFEKLTYNVVWKFFGLHEEVKSTRLDSEGGHDM
jgi:hypothetical protein